MAGSFVRGRRVVLRTLAGSALATAVLILTGQRHAEAQGAPTFQASLSFDNVSSCDFAPDDAVTVTIKDAPAGTELFSGPTSTDGGGCFGMGSEEHGQDLVPGMFIEVTDGTDTKQLTLVGLTIDSVDRTNDTVSGTSPPSAQVDVGVGDDSGGAGLTVNADGAGDWTANFSGVFDITGATGANASVADADGDRTTVQKNPPAFNASLSFDNVSGCNFAPSSSVTVTVKDAPAGTEVFSDTVPTDGDGCFEVGPDDHGQDLVPGMFVSVTDGTDTKELTLAVLTIDSVDEANDTVSGTADPNAEVNVGVGDGSGGADLSVTADGTTGAWTADFSGVFDIDGTTMANASVADADGDRTMVEEHPPTIDASLFSVEVFGCNFTPDDSVDVTIKDAPAGTVLFSGSVPTDGRGCFEMLGDQGSPQLEPGMFISVTDGVDTKELTLVTLTIDPIDPATDVVSGTAPPGAEVNVGVTNDPEQGAAADLTVTANGSGEWTADFSGAFDIIGGTEARASVADADGDRTTLGRTAPFIGADLSSDNVDIVGDFGPGATVEIYDAPGGTLLFSGPPFGLGPDQHGQDLVPGMFIQVTGGAVDKELTLALLTIDEVDAATDTVSGTADPGAEVGVNLSGPFDQVALTVTADGTGAWTADFGGLEDIGAGTHASARILDDDGDRTTVARPAPSIEGSLTSDSVSGCGFAPDGSVDVAIGGFNGSAPTDGEGCFEIGSGQHGQDLVPGMFISVTDGTLTRELTLDILTMDLDFAADTISGTAPPNAEVGVSFGLPERGDGFTTTADGTGAWAIDPGEELNPGASWRANVHDADGDATVVDREPSAISAHLITDLIDGCGFEPNDAVNLVVKDGPAGATLFSGPASTDGNGCFQMGPGVHGQDLVPGMFIQVTQGAVSVQHTLVDITVDAIDHVNDVVTGTAPPNACVNVHVERWDGTGDTADRVACADGTGVWTASFGVFDVTVAMKAEASSSDQEGDFDLTVTEKGTPPCFLDGTTLVIPIGDITLHRSGNDFDVTGLGIADPTCGGATVFNVDLVQVAGDGSAQSLTIDLSGGAFAPGATAEGSGASEIELEVAFGPEDSLVIQGGRRRDVITLGSLGINLNNDDDADVTEPVSVAALDEPGFGDVTVNGNAGRDTISGAGSDATGSPYPDPITLTGGPHADALIGGLGSDGLLGGDADDKLTGNDGSNVLDGGSGVDRVVETADVDFTLTTTSLTFGPSTDTLSSIERATLTGGPSANAIDASGFTGSSVLIGEGGNDTLTGGSFDDDINGGPGADVLVGREGNNVLSGGPGTDQVRYDWSTHAVRVNLSTGSTSGRGFSDSLSALENVVGSGFDDTLTGDASRNTIQAGAGNDSIDVQDGVGGNDVADGSDGTDTCLADVGDTKISCEL